MALIVKAEWEIQGINKGPERLNLVISEIQTTASKKERKLLRQLNLKPLITDIFSNVVVPILFRRGLK